jgi:hypothetical protein
MIPDSGERPCRSRGIRLPYSHLNLRVNPFGEPDLGERARLAVVTLPPWTADVPLQLIGGCGSGKTTHLLALQARHLDSQYYRLDLGQDRLPRRSADSAPLIVDEAQRLRRSHLRNLVQRHGRLALGSHEDLSVVAGRPFVTVRLGGWTLDRVRSIVKRRIEWARRGAGPVPTVSDAFLQALLARHNDSVRGIEWELYDVFQKLEEVCRVEV